MNAPQPTPLFPEPSIGEVAQQDREYWTEGEYERDDGALDDAA
ncbi:hypothetical protein AB0F24_17560 [Streptomyces platensis]